MFFMKKKGTEDLPTEDLDWARTVSAKKFLPLFREAVDQDNMRRVVFLLKNVELYGMSGSFTYNDAVKYAIEKNSVSTLRHLFDRNLMRYMCYATLPFKAMDCFRTAFRKDIFTKEARELILILVGENEGCNPIHCRVSAQDLAKEAVQSEKLEAAQALLEFSRAEDRELFRVLMEESERKRQSWVPSVMAWSEKFRDSENVIHAALGKIAGKGDVDLLKEMMARGARPDGDTLVLAAAGGSLQAVSALVESGMDMTLIAGPVLERLAFMNCIPEIVDYIRAATSGTKVVEEKERFFLAASDTLAERQSLPDGDSLTILFNFNTRQQMILTDKTPAAVVPFQDIEEGVIARAAERLSALGGNPGEGAGPIKKRVLFNPP